MRQSEYLVFNPVTVNILASLTWMCIRLTDGPNIKLVELLKLVGTELSIVCCLVIRGSTGGFLLLRHFSGVDSHPRDLQVSQYVGFVVLMSDSP